MSYLKQRNAAVRALSFMTMGNSNLTKQCACATASRVKMKSNKHGCDRAKRIAERKKSEREREERKLIVVIITQKNKFFQNKCWSFSQVGASIKWLSFPFNFHFGLIPSRPSFV